MSQLDPELCLDPVQDSRNTNTAVRNIFSPQNYPQEHQRTVSYKLAHFNVTLGLRDPSVFLLAEKKNARLGRGQETWGLVPTDTYPARY